MKKLLISLAGIFALSTVAYFTVAESDPVTAQARVVGTEIAELLNQRDQAYIKEFYTVLDGMIEKFTEENDVTKLKILHTIKGVLVHSVPYSPEPAVETVLSCYDSSKELKVCTMEYAPMCGEDLHTYGNACTLEAAGVKLLYAGECKAEDKPAICTMEYAPVCGTDGKTYGNLCGLKAADAGFLFEGECESNKDKLTCVAIQQPLSPTPCTREYAPVCGEDGTTYSNACMANNAEVTYKDGACE